MHLGQRATIHPCISSREHHLFKISKVYTLPAKP
uniref:Uncharacterized protein n=1 Tax=Anguilla anguilla TaxID=7936 RepID=A0A0E9PPE5_ANGAN